MLWAPWGQDLCHPPCSETTSGLESHRPSSLALFPEHWSAIPPSLPRPGPAVVALNTTDEGSASSSVRAFPPLPLTGIWGWLGPSLLPTFTSPPTPPALYSQVTALMSFPESLFPDCTCPRHASQGPGWRLPGQSGCRPCPVLPAYPSAVLTVTFKATAAQAAGWSCCQSAAWEAIQSHPAARKGRPGETDRSNPGLGGDS